VLGRRQRPHQRPALPARQARVGGLPDQHVTEQPDTTGPFHPLGFLIRLRHRASGLLICDL
jgi:hypothetical protein